MYYDAAGAGQNTTLNTGDKEAVLTMTVNGTDANGAPYSPGTTGSGFWLGLPFILNDNAGAFTYGGYTGEFTSYAQTASPGEAFWNGNTVTEIVPLNASQLATVQAGGDTVYGFNLELDPAVYPTGLLNVTFDSLSLNAPDSTSTMGLLGPGFFALMALRRFKK
jgi:hypothetical protein